MVSCIKNYAHKIAAEIRLTPTASLQGNRSVTVTTAGINYSFRSLLFAQTVVCRVISPYV